MPVWRCPYCGVPQEESSRCWVCRRSTTTCATCSHFRRGIAGGLGMCGLEPRRGVLDGTETRACWTAARPSAAGADSADTGTIPGQPNALPAVLVDDRPVRTFVPVDDPGGVTVVRPPVHAPGARVPHGPSNAWSLWDDAEL